jgi:hypothetical protein
MMRMTRGWTGLRTAVIALSLLAAGAPHAIADNILTYSTSGAVGTTGITGSNVISFVPVQSESVAATSNISLGYFQVAPLAAGQSTTYDNTPISLTIVPNALNSTSVSDAPITLSGFLNGVVSGPNRSSVQATFSSFSSPTFAVPNGTGTLSSLNNTTEFLVPSSVNNGQTTLQAQITTAIGPPIGPDAGVPEPSTIALFLSMVGGLGLRRFVQSRRQRAAA